MHLYPGTTTWQGCVESDLLSVCMGGCVCMHVMMPFDSGDPPAQGNLDTELQMS